MTCESVVSMQHAHAVGLVVLHWNFCENGLRHLLCDLSGMEKGKCEHFTNALSALQLIETLQGLAGSEGVSDTLREAVESACAAAEVCRLNRNDIAHSWIDIKGSSLYKPNMNRRKPRTQWRDFDLEVVRRVADECWTLGWYLISVGGYIESLTNIRRRTQKPLPIAKPERMPNDRD